MIALWFLFSKQVNQVLTSADPGSVPRIAVSATAHWASIINVISIYFFCIHLLMEINKSISPGVHLLVSHSTSTNHSTCATIREYICVAYSFSNVMRNSYTSMWLTTISTIITEKGVDQRMEFCIIGLCFRLALYRWCRSGVAKAPLGLEVGKRGRPWVKELFFTTGFHRWNECQVSLPALNVGVTAGTECRCQCWGWMSVVIADTDVGCHCWHWCRVSLLTLNVGCHCWH